MTEIWPWVLVLSPGPGPGNRMALLILKCAYAGKLVKLLPHFPGVNELLHVRQR